MSKHIGTREQKQEFFATELAPCPYLPGRLERRLVTLMQPGSRPDVMDILTEAGFRRSQNYVYRPICDHCQACVPVRIDVKRFEPGRTLRKTSNRNLDLTANIVSNDATEEQFELFHRYLLDRHETGGMASMGWWDYRDMVEQVPATTLMIEFRDAEGRLKGVTLTDRVRSGLSGVYKFFEPDEPKRSLGTHIIMWHIEQARLWDLDYVYLGYWIENCRKMAYKARFPALERLTPNGWQAFHPGKSDE